jgi:hypothetical protein
MLMNSSRHPTFYVDIYLCFVIEKETLMMILKYTKCLTLLTVMCSCSAKQGVGICLEYMMGSIPHRHISCDTYIIRILVPLT